MALRDHTEPPPLPRRVERRVDHEKRRLVDALLREAIAGTANEDVHPKKRQPAA